MPSIWIVQRSTMVRNVKQNIRPVRCRQVCTNWPGIHVSPWWLLLCSRKLPAFLIKLLNFLSFSLLLFPFVLTVLHLFSALIQELIVAEIRPEPFPLSPCLVSVSGLTCNTTGETHVCGFSCWDNAWQLVPSDSNLSVVGTFPGHWASSWLLAQTGSMLLKHFSMGFC